MWKNLAEFVCTKKQQCKQFTKRNCSWFRQFSENAFWDKASNAFKNDQRRATDVRFTNKALFSTANQNTASNKLEILAHFIDAPHIGDVIVDGTSCVFRGVLIILITLLCWDFWLFPVLNTVGKYFFDFFLIFWIHHQYENMNEFCPKGPSLSVRTELFCTQIRR